MLLLIGFPALVCPQRPGLFLSRLRPPKLNIVLFDCDPALGDHMAFRLVHPKYDRETERAYGEFRDDDEDGGEILADEALPRSCLDCG